MASPLFLRQGKPLAGLTDLNVPLSLRCNLPRVKPVHLGIPNRGLHDRGSPWKSDEPETLRKKLSLKDGWG